MKTTLLLVFLFFVKHVIAQSPVITSWLQNTSGKKGSHYVSGNSVAVQDNDSANVQTVYYSNNWVYIRTKGIPSYTTGPFLDGNPSLASNQNAIFKISRNPIQNTGTLTATTAGNVGVFINGIALFDYRDGVSWRNSTSSLAGGPLGGAGDGVWNRDAIVAEKGGFDCSKGHPAMGNYHHHQNPSAFKLDQTIISTICNLYNADGLYVIDDTKHSPLLGFAYDGFPIYGAYGYYNTNGTGGISRMKSNFRLRNISVRNTYYTGASVTAGPNVSITYPLGYFREDYEFVASADPNCLDIHNGRFCVTPEYPAGVYAYFCTVDSNWNSAYPYVIGPTFYGTKTTTKVTSITESVTVYPAPATSNFLMRLYIEGLYLTNNTMSSALGNTNADSVTIQLRSTVSPYAGLYSTSTTITTGGIINLNLPYLYSGNSYYIVVKHRNAIETWSKKPVTITSLNNTYYFEPY
ncbi:MAG: YHYH protein [Bacteroidetes bacterium]|nr:YHYH protein [Bacteroidota bacterium]